MSSYIIHKYILFDHGRGLGLVGSDMGALRTGVYPFLILSGQSVQRTLWGTKAIVIM